MAQGTLSPWGSGQGKGIDVRQTNAQMPIYGLFQTGSGLVNSGATVLLRVYEISRVDAKWNALDFYSGMFSSGNTFQSGNLDISLNYQKTVGGTVETGGWSFQLSGTPGYMTPGGNYVLHLNCNSGFPTDQMRVIQYGSEQGDQVIASGPVSGQGYLQADVQYWHQGPTVSGAVPNASVTQSGGLPIVGWASGCIAPQNSGQVVPISGINAVVPIASISGLTANSGLFVTVPIATISGLTANSGLFVTVPVATISGVQIASGTASGQFVSVFSGQLSGQPITLLSGYSYPASGVFTVATANVDWAGGSGQLYLPSGTQVLVYSGQLSGQPITLLSGRSYPASGVYTVATASVNWAGGSGQLYLASGSIFTTTFASGALNASGGLLTVGTWSGQIMPDGAGNVFANSVIGTVGGIAGISFPNNFGLMLINNDGTTQVDVREVLGVGITQASGVYINSGAISPTSFSSGTLGGGSGTIATSWGGSGAVVTAINLDKSGYTLLSGTLSGQLVTAASGLFVTVPIATISGLTANSGLFVTVPIATISGLTANSGLFVTVPIATISGLTANSGLFVTVPVATISGVQIASGSLSGQYVSVFSGQLSGQPITLLSGYSYPASGVFTVATANVNWAAGSGLLYLPSGTQVIVYSGSMSGVQPITLLSGYSYPASGVYVNAAVASGLYVIASVLSGNLSGQYVNVFSGSLSGQPISLLSGRSFTAPATTVNVGAFGGTAVTLDRSGLPYVSFDGVPIESGLNARQALALDTAALAGDLSGAATTHVTIAAANNPTVPRIDATVSLSGDRTTITLNPPA